MANHVEMCIYLLPSFSKSNKPRPRSIADRVTMLKDSQVGWKNKVEEKDQSKFTVEGKLNMAGRGSHLHLVNGHL